MGLGQVFSRLAKQEGGFFTAYERIYHYRFIAKSDEEKHYERLAKRNRTMTVEQTKRMFPVKPDDNGNNSVLIYGQSMPCLREDYRRVWPVRQTLCLVPKRLCRKCPHQKKHKRRFYCELLREKNKGLTNQVVNKAVSDVEEMLK